MKQFIAKHREEIAGVLSSFDRLIFPGTLRSISYPEGMMGYLWAKQVRLTEFGRHVLRVSERLKQACRAKAEALRRPMKYLASAGESKEEVARGIAAREKIEEGLVCVLSCVEPCQTFEVYRNRETRKLELVARIRKCLFLYHYSIHREFGFLNARIQTWFPFSIQVCRNGRDTLVVQGAKRRQKRGFASLQLRPQLPRGSGRAKCPSSRQPRCRDRYSSPNTWLRRPDAANPLWFWNPGGTLPIPHSG